REPPDRYRSAQELADDLRRFLEGRAVLARPEWRAVAIYRWSRRNPGVAALSSAVIVVVLTMLVVLLRYNSRLNESLQSVREQQRETERLRIESENRERALRRRVYADDVNVAGKAWANSDVEQVRKRLETYIPHGDDPDLRSFPWWILWRLSQE